MRYIIITAIFFALILVSKRGRTQDTIPSAGMEYWTSSGTYEDPTGWASLNILIDLGFTPSTFKSTDSYSGKFATKLESFTDTFGTGTIYPPLMFTGYWKKTGPNYAAAGGFSYTKRPVELTGYYKFRPADFMDTLVVWVYFWTWDTIKDTFLLVGEGKFKTVDTIQTYQKFTVPIAYDTTATPDSGSIYIYTTQALSLGTVVHIDELAFVSGAGLTESVFPSSFTLHQNYPNPVRNVTYIEYEIFKRDNVNLTVYDLMGKEISTLVNEEKPPGKYIVEWNVKGLPAGVYFYRIKTGADAPLTKKIIVAD